MFLRFDRARSGRPVSSKIVSGGARSGNFRVDFSGSRVFPDHVARSSGGDIRRPTDDSLAT